jgi:DNA-binding CsgD family transcriptional regulator
VKNFILYYLEKQLEDIGKSSILSESSSELDDLYDKGVLRKRKKALNLLLDRLKSKYVKTFYDKFPKIQYEDIEDAFAITVKKIIDERPKSKKRIELLFKKMMIQNLSEVAKKKSDVKKNLSCLKSIKKSTGLSVGELIRRAERLLTSQEKKIIELCAAGKSVRSIGKELNLSAPTAWRALNLGIDKVRLSHGMKSRKLG